MLKRLLCFSLFLLLLLPGCGKPVPATAVDGYTFVDALEREVVVADSSRVAALMGGFAETWLLAGGELCATTDDAFSERQLALDSDTVNLGFYNTPSIEELLACSPTLVLLSSETPSHVALADTLDKAGITTAYFGVTHFDDYLHMLDICTDITGRKDLYQLNGLDVELEIKEICARVPSGESPSILLLITHSGGTAVQRGDSMTGQMLSDLGCVNIADRNPSLLNDLSVEHILAEDPGFIFVIPMGNSNELAQRHLLELVEQNPAWASLSAVQHGRYILLPREGFLYKPNAAWAESYHYLAGVLYGQE